MSGRLKIPSLNKSYFLVFNFLRLTFNLVGKAVPKFRDIISFLSNNPKNIY